MGPKTTTPGTLTVIPSSGVTQKRSIENLITHIAKQDNHLWQALISLQSQSNGLVGSFTDWTSWDPKICAYDITNNVTPVGFPIPNTEVSAYYTVSWNTLLIELHGILTFTANTPALQVSLPVDVGETVLKTCSAYMIQNYAPPNSLTPTDNAIISVEAQKQVAILVVKPNFITANLACRFMMGGSLGIVQGA